MIEQRPSVDEVFGQALALEGAERAAYLAAACEGEPALRQRVEQLLAAYPQAKSFIETPALAGEETVLHASAGVGTQIGPYKLLELIGEGGMGLVYMAEQQRPVRRLVALKIVKPSLDSRQVIARFEAERQALAMMDHPGIARILEAGTIEEGVRDQESGVSTASALSSLTPDSRLLTPGSRPYFVMEVVRGLPITEFCDHKRLSVRQRLELFIQVCQAVQHAHQKGIIHRDLKPTNVLVTMHDALAVPKIIDFGIAKALGAQLTEHTLHTGFSQLVGTPLYMSPEQAEMNQFGVDTRSDVYSLGVILYELLTGTTPFGKETLKDAGFDGMRRMIREVEPPRPSTRISTLAAQTRSTVSERRNTDPRRISLALHGELDWIVMRALEKDRNRRYESASSFAADIQRYLTDEPVQACPASISYRVSKVARRYKVAAIAASVVTFTILASSAFSALKYFDERAARREADEQKLVAQRNARKSNENAAEATRERGNAVRQRAEAERQRDAVRQNLYYADMRLAYVDIGLGNTGRARDSLVAHFPDQGEADHRGWEWHYLLGRSHEAELVLYGHNSEIIAIAWSPDGNYIASASNDGSARVWDARTGKQLRRFDQGPTLKKCVAWSPDSKKLAWGSASGESALRIWDRDTDKIAVLRGHSGSLWAVEWSHDGKYVATGNMSENEPGSVRIWDVEKLESVAQFTPPFGNVFSVSWSPSDQLLAIAQQVSGSNQLLAVASQLSGSPIWNVASKQQIPSIDMWDLSCTAWHPAEMRLVTGNSDGECLIWDHDAGKVLTRWKAHRGRVSDIKWSPDGVHLLSSGADGTVKVWHSKEVHEQKSVADPGVTRTVAWDPSGRRFASAGSDKVIRVWATENRPSPLVIDTRLRGNLNLAWDSESSSLLLACGDAGKIVAFNASSGKQLEEIPVRLDGGRRLVSFRHVIQRSAPTADGSTTLSISGVPTSRTLAKVVSSASLNPGGTPSGGAELRNDGVLSPDRARIAYVTPLLACPPLPAQCGL